MTFNISKLADYSNYVFQATPKLSEDKVRQCVDARLGGDYPPKAVAKVIAGLLLLCPSYF